MTLSPSLRLSQIRDINITPLKHLESPQVDDSGTKKFGKLRKLSLCGESDSSKKGFTKFEWYCQQTNDIHESS